MNNSKQADTAISTALRARVPVIAVETPEEGRVLDLMVTLGVNPRYPAKRQAKDLTRPVYAWSISQGIVRIGTTGGLDANRKNEENKPDLADPIAAIKWMLEWGQDKPSDPAIFIILDAQPYFGSAQFTRLVRDASSQLRSRKQNLVLVAPNLTLPIDLMHDVTVISYPMPTVEELTVLVKTKAEAMEDQGIEVKLNGDVTDVAAALAGLTWTKCEEAIRVAIVRTGAFIADDVIPIMLFEKARIISASPALEYFHNKEAWDDVGGLDLLKPYAARAIRSMEPAARAYGVDRRRGILLVGMTGCGKSLMVKAIAGTRLPLIRLDVGALFGGLVGQSEQQCRQALKVIDAVGHAILWIDEIEKALGSGTGESDGGTSTRVLATILTWMEETKANVYVAATANDISKLRPELVRRFDCTFFVDLPAEDARREILSIHLRKRGRNANELNLDLDRLVAKTQSFTGGEIEQVIIEAIAEAYDNDRPDITQADLEAQCEATIPLIRTMASQMNEMRQWASRARAASSKQQAGLGGKAAQEMIEM